MFLLCVYVIWGCICSWGVECSLGGNTGVLEWFLLGFTQGRGQGNETSDPSSPIDQTLVLTRRERQ